MADRLRALAKVADEQGDESIGSLMIGYADALDALAEIRRQNPAGTAARAVQAANAALAAAARLFPEDAA